MTKSQTHVQVTFPIFIPGVHAQLCHILTLGAHGFTIVDLSVCVSVDAYSGITGYEEVHEQYQRLQNYMYLKNKMGFS
jgi:hypothetical protein